MNYPETVQELNSVLVEFETLYSTSLKSLMLIAGVSGAGRSTALRMIGDLGYYFVDNLPLRLFPSFLRDKFAEGLKFENLAVILDCSSAEQVLGLKELMECMRARKLPLTLLFLECTNEKLLRRYSETRRPHPVYNPLLDQTLEDTIERERALLAPLEDMASLVIDTTHLSIHELKRTLNAFAETIHATPASQVFIQITSFGFKYGLPTTCDFVIDVRFLTNPYFEESLRNLTGLDRAVFDYVMQNPETIELEQRLLHLLDFLLPRYVREGKSHITIGIGCTGGKHRSVSLVESLYRKLSLQGTMITPTHRDIEK